MFRAHEDAIDDGIAPDSDEYFAFIDQRLGIRRNMDEQGTGASAESPMSTAAAPKRAVQPSPAPVSRGSSRPNVMRLTAAEAETAAALGMKPEEYAKNKALLQKEGRYGH
jgi:phage I-like protein